MRTLTVVGRPGDFAKKIDLTGTDINLMYLYLDIIVQDAYGDEFGDGPSADHCYQLVAENDQLTCGQDEPLPNAPDVLKDIPVSCFYLTPGRDLVAVLKTTEATAVRYSFKHRYIAEVPREIQEAYRALLMDLKVQGEDLENAMNSLFGDLEDTLP